MSLLVLKRRSRRGAAELRAAGAWARRAFTLLGDVSVRGLALFFGAFSLANSLGSLVHGHFDQDIWWIDLSFLPSSIAFVLSVAAAVLFIAWAIVPAEQRRRRLATTGAAALFAVFASMNAVAFYRAWGAGSIAPRAVVPASLLWAAAFLWLGRRSLSASSPKKRPLTHTGFAVAVALLCAVLFPLAQMVFFGTTDYRRPADAAVVLGAKVTAKGNLSTALEDRVRTAADLYRAGLVSRLIMSGGVGESGVDETVAMRRRAIELGVPEDAIVLDHDGINTDATVTDTTAMFGELGVRRVLVVSQSWHLPRVKLAYLGAGWNVSTVPATMSTPITQTPYLMLREIPAFWKYWAACV